MVSQSIVLGLNSPLGFVVAMFLQARFFRSFRRVCSFHLRPSEDTRSTASFISHSPLDPSCMSDNLLPRRCGSRKANANPVRSPNGHIRTPTARALHPPYPLAFPCFRIGVRSKRAFHRRPQFLSRWLF